MGKKVKIIVFLKLSPLIFVKIKSLELFPGSSEVKIYLKRRKEKKKEEKRISLQLTKR